MSFEPAIFPDLAEPEPRAEGERIAPWQVRATIAYMHANLARPISLDELAETVGFSPFHFSRGFRNAAGEPPLRYLARIRIREACRLLVTTDTPVGEIAAAVGYRSPQGFARAFERLCGCPPRTHRQRHAGAINPPQCGNDPLVVADD